MGYETVSNYLDKLEKMAYEDNQYFILATVGKQAGMEIPPYTLEKLTEIRQGYYFALDTIAEILTYVKAWPEMANRF